VGGSSSRHSKAACLALALLVFSYCFFFMFVPVKVEASTYVNCLPYRLNGGVGNYGYNTRYFWIDSSASGYGALIQQAMDEWIYTTSYWGITTPISWRRTTVKSSSVMDIYANLDLGHSVIAATRHKIYARDVNPYLENWGWAQIFLNPSVFPKHTQFNQKGTVAHEMGHVFGLDETNSNQYSIMCQLASGRKVNRAQPPDLRTINLRYGR